MIPKNSREKFSEKIMDSKLRANVASSKKQKGAAEIQSPSELTNALSSKGDKLYLLPGALRDLPSQFDAGEREVNFVTLAKHKEIIEYSTSDQVISISLGMTVGELDELTAKNKQFLPLSCNHESTLFDVINSGDGGLWEHAFGGPRDLVMGLHAVLPDGKTIKTGGKVVKNVTGYDTTKIFVGGRMYFGIPIAAHLRLYARPEWTHTMELAASSVLQLLDQASVFMQSDIPITTLVISGSRDGGARMFVQLTGHKIVADELVKPLKAIAAKALSISETSSAFDSREEELLQHCQANINAVEISASISQMRLILSLLSDVIAGKTEIKIRPGTGRFLICCGSAEERSAVLDHLRDALEKESLSLVAAYADESLERKIERIGITEEGSSNQAIVRSLKLRFDQKRILNPLVSW